MIITTALIIMLAALLNTVLTNMRINTGSALLDQARNAAEGAAEVATAELDRRVRSFTTILDNPLSDFSLSASAASELALGDVSAESIAFQCGNLSPAPDFASLVDPTDPFNAADPDKGKPMHLRHVYIYGRATAVDPLSSRAITRYVSSLLEIRTRSWLNYAVFGNLDIEFTAGRSMTITGPVHSNSDIYAASWDNTELRIMGTCTTASKIYRALKSGNITVNNNGSVSFPIRANPTGSSDIASMGLDQDSTSTGFPDFAMARWSGFVQDASLGVLPVMPPGMPPYVEDDYTTSSIDETRNHAYALIEPQLSTNLADDPYQHIYAGNKGTPIENLKVSAVAGLVIRIKHPPTTPAQSATFWENTQRDNDDPLFDPGYELVVYQPTITSRPLNRSNLPARQSNGCPVESIVPITIGRMSVVQRNRLFAAIRLIRYDDAGANGDGPLVGTSFAAENDTDTALATPTNQVWYGIYDRRQGYQPPNDPSVTDNYGYRGAHHALHVDLGRLNTFLNATDAEWADTADSTQKVYDPALRYSGVVYVQFPLEEFTGAVLARRSTDGIRPVQAPTLTAPGYALILRNASRLPALPQNLNARDNGFVIGTNAPAYIVGHFNADGLEATGSTTAADSGHPEIAAAVAAEAVTLLSQNFATQPDHFRLSAIAKRAATFTEVSAAIFAGYVPTPKVPIGTVDENLLSGGGGVHNYLRLLESWSGGIKYVYRGSFVLLFESEVSTQPMSRNGLSYWFDPPSRQIGYHDFFASGVVPPAWPPLMRSARRLSLTDISPNQWASGPPTPPKAASR